MKFTFKFLLSNGKTERHTFEAFDYPTAHEAAFAYSQTAFAHYEVLDFFCDLID